MAQTKAEKEIIRGKLELEAIEQRKRYLLTVPKRLVELISKAQKIGIHTVVELTENGPLVKFRNDKDPYIDDVATYDMDEWQLDELEHSVQRAQDLIDAKMNRKNAAIAAWAKLTEEERTGIEENIGSLSKSHLTYSRK
jgi:hypothetical protein